MFVLEPQDLQVLWAALQVFVFLALLSFKLKRNRLLLRATAGNRGGASVFTEDYFLYVEMEYYPLQNLVIQEQWGNLPGYLHFLRRNVRSPATFSWYTACNAHPKSENSDLQCAADLKARVWALTNWLMFALQSQKALCKLWGLFLFGGMLVCSWLVFVFDFFQTRCVISSDKIFPRDFFFSYFP